MPRLASTVSARTGIALALAAALGAGCTGNGPGDSTRSGGNGDSSGSGGAPAGGGTGGAGLDGGAAGGSGGPASDAGADGATGGAASGTGGAAIAGSGTCAGGTSTAGDVTVALASLEQKISGFGASTAWGSTMSAADAATLWSTTSGAGLSLHRIRIDYQTGQTSELQIAKAAVSYGVTVWATPWTPPVADKSNDSPVEGTLTDGADYAAFLFGFVNFMQAQGVNIFAVSAGNEPDANVDYESCVYTAATMDAFIGDYLGSALLGTGARVMAPETQNWCSLANFEPTLVKDPAVSIIATHEYGCNPQAYPDIAQAGKEFWETEISDTASDVPDTGMPSALRVAKLINDAMTIANMNAWHYWWVYPASADNGALWDFDTQQATKRLWVEGNYARFVRPGFQRVDTAGTAPAGVLLSAYTNPADGTVAIVAINTNAGATPISFFVDGAAPCLFTPWVTSAGESLVPEPSVTTSSGRLTYTLEAQSVTTLVGKP